MTMKKTTTVLIVILLILSSAAAWYFATNKGKPRASNYSPDMEFAVDPNLVHKVFIADRSGNKTTILKVDGEWLFEGKHKLRPSTIKFLLDVIGNVEVKYRPAKAAIPLIVKDLSVFGIEVELYDEKEQLLKNYYVGGMDTEGKGTYMIMAESDEPYVTHVQHFVGSLRTRFAMKGDEWRDRSVFAENPDDIMSVSIEYPQQKDQSFKFTREDDGFSVVPFFNTTPIIDKQVLKGKPEQFLNGFKSKIAEAFQNKYTLMDQAKARLPFAIISMTKRDGTEKVVRFIPYQKLDLRGNLVKQDPNSPVFRFHADCSWGDFMLVQQQVFQDVFWPYEGFFK